MKEHEDLVHIYTGSFIEANFLKSLLEENGIGVIIRNTLRESMVAGWASGAPEDAGLIFVSEEHETEARSIIEDYISRKK